MGARLLWVHGCADVIDVSVQAAVNAHLKFVLRQVINLCNPLGGVEITRCKGQKYVVDGQKLRTGTFFLLVVPNLHVLRAAQGQLGEHLLLLVAEFLDLLGQLPVHVVAFALSDLGFLLGDVAQDLGTGRTIRRKELFDRPGSKIHAGFSHNRVDDLAGAVEVGPAGCVIAQAGAPNTLFVLLIALLSGFFVLLNELNVLQGEHRHL